MVDKPAHGAPSPTNEKLWHALVTGRQRDRQTEVFVGQIVSVGP